MIPTSNFKDVLKKTLRNPTFGNVLIVGIITLFVKCLSFLKEIIIADNFGLSEVLDTFYIAILFPSLVNNIFSSSFKSVFIPNYVNEQKNGNNIGAFQSACFLITSAVTIFILIIAYLFTDVYLETFFSGHSERYYSLVKIQFFYVAPSILFWGGSSLINGLLNIHNEFRLTSISGFFTPLSIIVCLIFFKAELGVLVMAVGTLIGSITSFLFIIIVALKRKIIHLEIPQFYSESVKVLYKQLPAKLSSSLLNGINPLVDQYFSAQLFVGAISALNYGIKLPTFFIGIVSIALGNVLLPFFSKKAIDNLKGSFNLLKRIIKYSLLASITITVLGIALSTPIVRLVFERNAFQSSDSLIVSEIQQMYLLQIPSYVMGIVMVKFLTAINKNNFMVFTSAISLGLNIILNYVLIKTMGVYGLALATSLVSIVNSIILYKYILHLNKHNV